MWVAIGLRDFTDRYPELGLPYDQLAPEHWTSPERLLCQFLANFRSHAKHGEKLFIIIDEYDHFATGLLPWNKGAPDESAPAVQAIGGLIRQFYACLKPFYGNGRTAPIKRLFITGVTALPLGYMASGFSPASDISSLHQFNAMAGFTHEELSRLIDETVDLSANSAPTKSYLMEALERLCGGYSFSRNAQERVFNPNMSLAMLRHVAEEGNLPDPESMPEFSGMDPARLQAVLGLADKNEHSDVCSRISGCGDVPGRAPENLVPSSARP